MKRDLARVRDWVNAHRPDKVSGGDEYKCVEPPVIKLTDPSSLMRIEIAARGPCCEHLQPFDLESYVHTMRSCPPKSAWRCPVCDKPIPLHKIELDAFAQSILDFSAANVTEVLVADTGKWEVSATEEALDEDDSSGDENMPECFRRQAVTQVDLQQAALNLGRAFAPAPQPPAKPAKKQPAPPAPDAQAHDRSRQKSRSRSPPNGKAGKKKSAQAAPDDAVDKMQVWFKLQGIAKPEELPAPPPKEEETRMGFLPAGTACSRCGKIVAEQGGVYCGRKMADGTVRGCHQAICWKCMNKGGKDFGTIKCTKSEFLGIGVGAWWMHEGCMLAEDKRAYFGEEDDVIEAPKDQEEESEDDGPGKFAWE
jgi:hypothetical protein